MFEYRWIARDSNRQSAEDDYTLNVQPELDREPLKEAVEVRNARGKITGWRIQYRYE